MRIQTTKVKDLDVDDLILYSTTGKPVIVRVIGIVRNQVHVCKHPQGEQVFGISKSSPDYEDLQNRVEKILSME